MARDYTRRGYDILHRRWRGPAGEIDLILRDGAGLIFVEVKKSHSIARAADRLTAAQMRRIYTSAEAFLGTQPHGSLTETRFDVALLDARGQSLTVQRVQGDHATLGEMTHVDLADFDVVWLRQDPPFDMHYITTTHLLDLLAPGTLVVNDPREVVNAPEKMFVLDYARFMPPTLVARHLDDLRDFQKRHGSVVVKPLHGNGGKAIFRIDEQGTNLSALSEVFDNQWPEAHMVQAFLPTVSEGDKRIVLVDGVVAGAINRKPGEGEFRSNLAQGGSAEAATLTAREEEICAAMGPELERRGLVFVGIDRMTVIWMGT